MDFTFSEVYASTSYISKIDIWIYLSNGQGLFNLHWYCDFNTIIESGQLDRISIDDFQDWTNAHDLIHLPTYAKFT